MVAAKKTQEAPADESSAAAQDSQATRSQVLERLQNEFRSRMDAKKRDATALLVIATAFANNPNADEKHHYFKAYSELINAPVDISLIHLVSQNYKKNPLDIFDEFPDLADQSCLLQALIYCVESDHVVGKVESTLNYEQIHKAVQADDVLRDVISFFLTKTISSRKNEGASVKPDEVLKELVDAKAVLFEAKDMLKTRYMGHWKKVLERAERRILDLKQQEATNKSSAAASEARFRPYSMTENALLDRMDKHIQFASVLTESEVYTLLGIIGHASSADGQQTDAYEAQFLKDLIQRLRFKINREQFSASAARSLPDLLAQVKTPALAKAVYHETMCIMTSNLEITIQEKDMLTTLANSFNLPAQDIRLLHARHYLDSGLKGLEDSLQAMPVMLKSAHHSLHKYQEVLSELEIVPLADIVQTGKEYLEALESTTIPTDAPPEARVAILSLVGNAMRLDNVFDDGEKAFLQKTMKDLGLTGDDVKAFPQLMKQATVSDICLVIKKWALSQKKTNILTAVAYYVLRAISADGVIDAKEDKFKSILFHELGLEPSQYARILLRVQLDLVS